MQQQRKLLVAAVVLVAGTLLGAALVTNGLDLGNAETTNSELPDESAANPDIQQFGTEAAFQEYIADGQQINRGGQWQTIQRRIQVDTTAAVEMASTDAAAPSGSSGGIDRIAESNIQVAGLDEPDVVKTDGE